MQLARAGAADPQMASNFPSRLILFELSGKTPLALKPGRVFQDPRSPGQSAAAPSLEG